MTPERHESDWRGKRAVECRIIAECGVAYRDEPLSGAVMLRGRQGLPATKEPVQVEVSLIRATTPFLIPFARLRALDSRWLGRVPALAESQERSIPFSLTAPLDSPSQPGMVIATVTSAKWHRRHVARAVLGVRIGAQRSVEELVLDLAALAEARIHTWNTRTVGGGVRARLKPLREGAGYRVLEMEVALVGGRAQGRVSVTAAKTGLVEAYAIDLRLADRAEYRRTLWKCLSKYLDLSGQLPIPATSAQTPAEQLPRPVDAP